MTIVIVTNSGHEGYSTKRQHWQKYCKSEDPNVFSISAAGHFLFVRTLLRPVCYDHSILIRALFREGSF